RNPVKGQPLSVSEEDPFDPIELYAYFLGLAINWRKQGIYLRYYMTFPVAYPQSVKDKILASFRRGLQRSLPAPLIEQEAFNQFTVEERASEPAAFAAAALPFYQLEPTPEGLTYAVFDFGGGTTDFDYGIYREPTPEEEADGYETVFEHFGASGDAYLGGENLLENLAYRVFEANQSLLREKRIAITCPLDAEPFPGSEMLLDRTQAAVTNTQMLISRLRPFWEAGEQNNQGIEKVKLLNRAGEEVVAELVMPYEELSAYLEQRLEEGVDKFLTAMRKAFNEHDHQPEEVHVFLAGNASRSSYLQDALNDSSINEQALPRLTLYDPIDQQADAPFQPTAKTGVALGLLDLCPGSRTLVINHAQQKAGGDAPFAYYVGRIRRGTFQPVLKRHAVYGQWQEVGVVIDGHFVLAYSLSPLANEGRLTEDSSELSHIPLQLYQADRQRLFVRAITPDQVTICTAENHEVLEKNAASGEALDNMQNILLR
ncbi:MAG: hypothetical protein IBX50_20475, partial [Marinospirillum sp.]|uniref:hypothetical protein n=1 Tax=Marinospirillum sp. TaxID=2183934 RepID=UPI001A02A649